MKARVTVALLVALVLVTSANHLHGQKIKMIVDQDARGPATTDMQSILIFLQSDRFDVLGITTVSGDQWVKEETQRTLRLLEITGRTDVPVIQGAEFPLLNSKEESERWEALYGKFRYKGCWSDFSDRPASTPPAFRAGYHEPDVIPPLVEGAPHTKPLDETAAHSSGVGRRPAHEHRISAAPRSRGSNAREGTGADGQRHVRGQRRNQRRG